jgi:hypothetical protein
MGALRANSKSNDRSNETGNPSMIKEGDQAVHRE